MLGLFVNTMTPDDKYSRLNRGNFTQQIQMQLSQKTKNFSQVFIAYLNSTSNFEFFETTKSDVAHTLTLFEIIDPGGGCYSNV